MPPRRIPRDQSEGAYFLTFTVEWWIYLFDRHERWPILAETLAFYREQRGLKILGFVFMLNHVHLITVASDTAAFIRDFKRFTTRRLAENISATEPGLLRSFETSAGLRLWQPGSAAKRIETEPFFRQKIDYLHENPVRKQYVALPDHWYWSSANPTCPLQPDPW